MNRPRERKILIVDDDRDLAASLKTLLVLKEYKVNVAHDFATAIEKAKTTPCDLAIIDISLGAANGVALIPELTRIYPEIMCILMTGNAQTESAIEAMKVGAYDFLCKPFHIEDLLATLERGFARLQMQEEHANAVQNSKWLKKLIDQSHDLIFILDSENVKLVYVNDHAARELKYTREQLLELTMAQIEVNENVALPLPDRPLMTAQDREPATYQEMKYRRQDGSMVNVEASLARFEQPGRSYVIIVARDITERIENEKERAAYHENLEKMVVEKSRELNRSLEKLKLTNQRLVEANQHKNQFLSSMSHELRTPLNAIIGYSDLLGGKFYGELNDKQENFVTQIGESGKLLLTLINNLLDLSRIDAGKLTLVLEPIELKGFIDAIVDLIHNQIEKKKLQFQVHIHHNLTAVFGDREKIRQVILNLLSNAIKFTPPGGTIMLDVLRFNPNHIKIEVKDSGLGIDEEEQKQIFSEFHKRRQLWNNDIGGPGIGLALTQRLVEMHGGSIGVRSKKGVGSTFWFTLPLRRI